MQLFVAARLGVLLLALLCQQIGSEAPIVELGEFTRETLRHVLVPVAVLQPWTNVIVPACVWIFVMLRRDDLREGVGLGRLLVRSE